MWRVHLHHDAEAHESVRLASEWLLTNFRQGWGYNERVPIDCDSTAWGILAVTGAGVKLPTSASELLTQYRDSDGLYHTFSGRERGDHWGDAHLDVTVIALRALLRADSSEIDAIFQTAERVVEIGEKREWQAYWWGDQMYAVAHALEALNEFANWMQIDSIVAPFDEHFKRSLLTRIHALNTVWRKKRLTDDLSLDPFAAALRLKAAVFGGSGRDSIVELTDLILKLQQSDGRWRGEEKLRVTDRSVARPWEHQNAGPLFADTENIFTTATVLDALQVHAKTTQAI